MLIKFDKTMVKIIKPQSILSWTIGNEPENGFVIVYLKHRRLFIMFIVFIDVLCINVLSNLIFVFYQNFMIFMFKKLIYPVYTRSSFENLLNHSCTHLAHTQCPFEHRHFAMIDIYHFQNIDNFTHLPGIKIKNCRQFFLTIRANALPFSFWKFILK